MLAIIGSLAGFFSSLIPEIFHFLKDKKDKDHELKLITLQIEAMKSGNHSKLEEVQIKADSDNNKYLYYHASRSSKVKWIDALSASVRPAITYTFFLLYAALKIADFINIGSMAPIWTDEDQGILCAVIGFWFGQRAFSRARTNANNTNGY